MASVTITVEDTPVGGVSVKSNYVPAIGQRTTVAQVAAQEMINRTCREYGLANPLRNGVDIDSVHRSRDSAVSEAEARMLRDKTA